MRAARASADVVVVSLFVNPAQFGPGEDLSAYPRDFDRDRALAEEEGVDVLFAPAVEEVYPDGFDTLVQVGGVTGTLEGDARPGHFAGVATIVAKLFNMVAPDVAWFGQKDAQQALVIRKLVRDLDIPVRIELAPTVREPDGLAMSSRNAYLTPEERLRAAALSRALAAGWTPPTCWPPRARSWTPRASSRSTWSFARPTTCPPPNGSTATRCWRSPRASAVHA
jgi:pantoate--beta-alanine ligase